MRKSAIDDLKPSSKLTLHSYEENEEGHVMEGCLMDEADYWYPIQRGVPCFLSGGMRPNLMDFAKKHNLPYAEAEGMNEVEEEQDHTNVAFSDKWRRFKEYGFREEEKDFLLEWFCQKLGMKNRAELVNFYKSKKNILEVGTGSGFNLDFISGQTTGKVWGLDISEAAYTTFGNTHQHLNCNIVQADLMNAPFADNKFDLIIADGVLHHTPNTYRAVEALYKKLQPGGHFFFYVYKKMGAARYFVDQYIRENSQPLTPEECYEMCEGITELGRELSALNAKVNLKKGVPLLGIPAGEHNVQRLIYYNFMKCFWNDCFDFDTNNMVNFDWYYPHNAWQHTEEEVEGWLKNLGVKEYRFNAANPNGICVFLQKPQASENIRKP